MNIIEESTIDWNVSSEKFAMSKLMTHASRRPPIMKVNLFICSQEEKKENVLDCIIIRNNYNSFKKQTVKKIYFEYGK